MHTLIRTIALVVCCVVLAFRSSAQQTPYLEKTVSIRSSTITYSELFRQLSNQTGVVFSYTNFDDHRKVTVNYSQKPLRYVLNDLFNDNGCTYKLKGKYVILTCKPAPKKAEAQPAPNTNIVVNGYIYDAVDSSLIAESSVYLRQNRQSAITNDYGYFSMSFPKTSDVLSISVAKENYEDTTIVILSKQRTTMVIYLQPKAPPTTITIDDSLVVHYEPVVDTMSKADTLAEPSDFWARFRKEHSNLRNISDTLFTKFSVSLVPPLSTNRLLAVNTVNRVSLNILAGYSRGIDGFEIGGLANLDYGDVRYLQIGGLTNLVSGSLTGVQVGGLLNTVGKDVDGLQIAGLVNVDRGNVRFIQIGGIGNTVFGSASGLQLGGIFNYAGKRASGVQIAGISNFTPAMDGFQLAGIANITAHRIDGCQLAGIANTADTVYGTQIAGIVNRAGHIEGSQIGLINVARSTSGVPIGLISYVHDGYHKLELATDENFLSTFSIRTGVNALHNIFLAGAQISGPDRLWTFGYGLGTAIRLSRRFYLSIDATGQQVQAMNTGNIDYNLLTKGYIGVEYRIGEKISIAAGPTVNWHNADMEGEDYDIVREGLDQPAFYEDTHGQFSNRVWVGGRLSIKFL